MKILQISSHIGGGLGKVIINWVREDIKNTDINYKIVCLEQTNNATEDYSDIKHLIYEDVYKNKDLLYSLIEETDIVILNWYNHPLIYDLILNFKWPKCRLIGYNHVSSLYPPYTCSKKLIDFFDKFIFTTKASFEAKEISSLSDDVKNKLGVIESSFGSEKYNLEHPIIKENNNFYVGYTGTASYSKLDSDFVSLCQGVNISDIKYIVCSSDNQNHIYDDICKYNMKEQIKLMGRVDSVESFLKKFHVFGYPLQKNHLGSAEQSIGEAMLFGAVPVVLDNPAERYIVEHNKTGIIAKNKDEYINAIKYLYNNRTFLKELSRNAHYFSKYFYSMERKIKAWRKEYNNIIKESKKDHYWDFKNKDKLYNGYELYIESLGDYGNYFKKYIIAKNMIKKIFNSNVQFNSENKGSVKQYLKYFNNDKIIKEWVDIIND